MLPNSQKKEVSRLIFLRYVSVYNALNELLLCIDRNC